MLRSLRPYLVVLGVLWLLPAVLVVVLHFSLPDHNTGGQCEGLGWGCTLPPADGVLLLGMMASPFLLAAGMLGCAVVAFVRSRRRRTSAAPGTSRRAGVTSS
ncbi:hypothetical protein KMZ32_11195 [Phycicoccus sp. MAQZ13P-2]|uniref:hypothetical protein n=1 Tax=Phycicoccus mangrovi TaxID=2840470 RepID=UPI001C003EF4|nr:hypothetical protein [Phycicoccus mangrovi]MBT9257830.1 hypothetical protein [Phycicoccus mangrovi]MBT9274636.1 hypothetical protein [Phycicoccus mangrovi]